MVGGCLLTFGFQYEFEVGGNLMFGAHTWINIR